MQGYRVRRMGVAAFYRVMRDVHPDKLTFEDGWKGSNSTYHMHFPQKDLFHKEKA